MIQDVQFVESNRSAALASHHFVLQCGFAIDIQQPTLFRRPRLDICACQILNIADDFAHAFTCWIDQSYAANPIDKRNADDFAKIVKYAFDHAALTTSPSITHVPKSLGFQMQQ